MSNQPSGSQSVDKRASKSSYTSKFSNTGRGSILDSIMSPVVGNPLQQPRLPTSVPPLSSTKQTVNTVDSDEEDVPAPPPGPPPRDVQATSNPLHPLLGVGARQSTTAKIDPQLTVQDITELKILLKENTTLIRNDFLTIMSKLQSIELLVNTLVSDVEILKKSTARFSSSGPSTTVGVAKRFDW